MKNKTIFFLQIQRIFTWSNNGETDTILRANICAADTPDIVISQDDRREISLRVSLVQLRATSGRHPCSYFSEATGTPVYA